MGRNIIGNLKVRIRIKVGAKQRRDRYMKHGES